MTRNRIIFGTAVSALALICASPGLAQFGSSGSAGSSGAARIQAPPPVATASRPTASVARDTLSVQRYLNGGDYAGAQGAGYALRIQAYNENNGFGATRGPSSPAQGRISPGSFDNFGAFLGNSNSTGYRVNGVSGQLIVEDRRSTNPQQTTTFALADEARRLQASVPARIGLGTAWRTNVDILAPSPSQPTSLRDFWNDLNGRGGNTAYGNNQMFAQLGQQGVLSIQTSQLPRPDVNAPSRTVTRQEQAETRYIETTLIPALQQNLQTAQVALRIANQGGNDAQQNRAQALVNGARTQLDQARGVAAMSHAFESRGFSSETQANLYINTRMAVTNGLLGVASANALAAETLVGDVRRDYGGLGGTNAVNNREYEVFTGNVRESRLRLAAGQRAAPRTTDLGTPEERAALRAHYGDNRDLVPSWAAVEAEVADNNRTENHSIRDANIDPRPPARRPSGGGNANVAPSNGRPPQTSSGSPQTATIEPDAPPQLPGGPNYPTARPPSARNAAIRSARREAEEAAREAIEDGSDLILAEQADALAARTLGRLAQRITEADRRRLAAQRSAAGDSARIGSSFDLVGNGTFQIARLSPIYDGYDINRILAGSRSGAIQGDRLYSGLSLVTWSPSSAGTSLSAAGVSLAAYGYGFSLAGIPGVSRAGLQTGSSAGPEGRSLISMSPSNIWGSFSNVGYSRSNLWGPYVEGGTGIEDPGYRSLYTIDRRANPWNYERRPGSNQIARNMFRNPFEIQRDPDGSRGDYYDAEIVGNVFGSEDEAFNELAVNGLAGLDRLLAQPFNVLLTWGPGAFDLDLHLTGPTSEESSDRFHVYFAAPGSQTAFPYAELIRDCVCTAGSEVILTTQLNRGGAYRISVFNFGDQSATSTNLANNSLAQIQIVRGGTPSGVGQGTTIVGGRTLLTTNVPSAQPGNTWVAVEINPDTGNISLPGVITNNRGSESVP